MLKQVEPATLSLLLDVQAEDSAIARLQQQRETLPESERLARVEEHLSELEADIAIATKQLDEITHEHNRREGEIELIAQKLEREQKKMFSGAVSNPKELSALQAEVEMLERKRSESEDGLLEVMVGKDQATETLERLRSEETQIRSEADELRTAVAKLTADIDASLEGHAATRRELVAGVPEDLLSLYEKIRDQKGGVGAAALEGGTCQGCHTKLPAKEAERVKSEGGLQRCDNCRRILVAH